MSVKLRVSDKARKAVDMSQIPQGNVAESVQNGRLLFSTGKGTAVWLTDGKESWATAKGSHQKLFTQGYYDLGPLELE